MMPVIFAGLERLRMPSSTSAEDALGLLDAGAFGGAHVQADLAGIDVGEKVGSHRQEQQERPGPTNDSHAAPR
jgi:hypothetical protein